MKPTTALCALPFALALLPSAIALDPRRHRHDAPSTWEEWKASKDPTPKYFSEAGNAGELSHYDARFFQGEVGYSERRLILRGLVRSYLVTMQTLGVETWLAHGTLLGWWWNGQVLPWDSDLDVQVSNATIVRMATELNMTSHAFSYIDSNGDDASRAYLIDVNPNYVDMEKGNGNNVIDARWVDKETGMYIDITALRERSPHSQPGKWSCKNKHKYGTQEIWPLRVSEYEGVRALVPRGMEGILADEYGSRSMVKTEYSGHTWNKDIKEWVKRSSKYAEARKEQVSRAKAEELRKEGRSELLDGP